MSEIAQAQSGWISHLFTRTYRIAGRLASFARAADIHEIEEFWTTHTSIEELLPPWQKTTVVHHFARWAAHSMYYHDTGGPYIHYRKSELESDGPLRRLLPVDAAMMRYGFTKEFFRVPQPDGEYVKVPGRNIRKWVESSKVADACFDYFTEEVMWSAPYDDLLNQVADEVFHVLFNDRATLAGLNELAAHAVAGGRIESELNPNLVTLKGRLRRRRPPTWVQRAVFHRDRGNCSFCGRDVSGLTDPLAVKHYDHIIPPDEGGLNDVTNIQLMCAKCNVEKSSKLVAPSALYRRWY